ncbi:DNA-binding MarR family transcriptional regulator [Thermocatellispora tengchongensis]|uniref:DNA-binding MarR family transcriptional regulator n=1 Tax=Thermocatellispora tengchongensis TaxID=1073253 RepID=A0A840NUF5_9ACTN|nr:MarR family transcriptional regulator [Thermocatellispora tengchongensis]MBB5131188.1 DNA-binding MarR family transcriptional regulator [Thermocatellispora tengchongensis]
MAADIDAVGDALTRLVRVLKSGRLHDSLVNQAGVQIDRPGLAIMNVLRDAGEPRRIGQIAAELQVEGPHITRHVGHLERRGYIRRLPDPADRRAWLIEPTDAGLEAMTRCRTISSAWLRDVVADWPEEDLRELTRLVPRLADALEANVRARTADPAS